jgi:small GTP-binding protein
MSRTPLE